MLRKKRVTISEEAQAAIATGMPVDQALAEHGTPAAEPAASDPPAAPAVVPVADPAPPAAEATPPAAEASSDPDPDPVPATPAADASTVTALIDRLQESQNTVATQAAQITQLEAAATQQSSTHEALKGVAIEAVNRWQIGLGGVATDLSSLSAENLLAQYQSTMALMNERYPVGGKAEVPVDDGSHTPGTVVPLVSPAVARATQIRK